MPPRKRKPRVAHPVDVIIEKTVIAHASTARARKEADERQRLAPRRRIARSLFQALKRELNAKDLNGIDRTDAKLAELCESIAKQAAKTIGIETSAKRD